MIRGKPSLHHFKKVANGLIIITIITSILVGFVLTGLYVGLLVGEGQTTTAPPTEKLNVVSAIYVVVAVMLSVFIFAVIIFVKNAVAEAGVGTYA